MSSKHSHPDFKEGNDRYVGANKSSQAHLSLSVAWQRQVQRRCVRMFESKLYQKGHFGASWNVATLQEMNWFLSTFTPFIYFHFLTQHTSSGSPSPSPSSPALATEQTTETDILAPPCHILHLYSTS